MAEHTEYNRGKRDGYREGRRIALAESRRDALLEGAREERERIKKVVQSNGFDWSHDPRFSPLQHFLNWIYEEEDKEARNG